MNVFLSATIIGSTLLLTSKDIEYDIPDDIKTAIKNGTATNEEFCSIIHDLAAQVKVETGTNATQKDKPPTLAMVSCMPVEFSDDKPQDEFIL